MPKGLISTLLGFAGMCFFISPYGAIIVTVVVVAIVLIRRRTA